MERHRRDTVYLEGLYSDIQSGAYVFNYVAQRFARVGRHIRSNW
jgi:hypothetical protein